MTTIVKIGTESLLDFDNSQKIDFLVEDLATLVLERKEQVILVSSGAVGFGRIARPNIDNKQVLASIGWGILLEKYRTKFEKYNLTIGGILVTHADIEDSASRALSLQNTVKNLWSERVLPIVNENDTLSLEEMDEVRRGADNDKNAFLLAKLFHAKYLFFLTNTNGIYRDKRDSSSRITTIRASDISDEEIHAMCGGEKSVQGTGGMESKFHLAKKAGRQGIAVHIGDGVNSRLSDMSKGGTNILPCD